MGKGRTPEPGKRGRPAKPPRETTWKLAETIMPAKPEELTGIAAEQWHLLEPYLVALDRVTHVDRQPLTAYCIIWQRISLLANDHFSDSSTLLWADGPSCEVVHPLLPELMGYCQALHKIAIEFGLTARSRDLDGMNGNKIASWLKRLVGNTAKKAESSIPESKIPLLPKWSDEDMEPPMWMNTRMLEEYDYLATHLINLDLFTPLDKPHLCILAMLNDLVYRANDQLRDDWTYVHDKKTGEVLYKKAHPLHQVIRDLIKVQREYWKAYGMSPLARRIFGDEERSETAARPLIFKGAG